MGEWVLEDFVIKRTIGRGHAGYIYLALHIPTAKTYALKTCNQIDSFGKTLLRLEIQNHLYLIGLTRDDPEDHEVKAIIELHGSFKIQSRSWCLVLEYAPLGDLHTRLQNQVCKCFSDTVAADYVRQIAQALNFCHRHCVIHRDVKLENIFLAEDGTIRLGDFGWSLHLTRPEELVDTEYMFGTPEYGTPEMVQGEPHGRQVDIWALGVIAYELLHGYPPFYVKTKAQALDDVIVGLNFEIERPVMTSAREFITHLLGKKTFYP